jgi:cyclic-di-GMP-binding protein
MPPRSRASCAAAWADRFMADFDLPVADPDAKPGFRDATGCSGWLQGLALINVSVSHGSLLAQLNELNRSDIAPVERLKILELLREAVVFVQTEQEKKFTNRPVPLVASERDAFNAVVALWDALMRGYQYCLKETSDLAHTALACQRALWCLGQRIGEHYKVYQEIPAGDWQLLHRLYAHAEAQGVAQRPVPHPVYKKKIETRCVETYVWALLLNLANPNEHAPRQTAMISRWLERWAREVPVSVSAPATDNAPLAVDLLGDAGPARNGATGENVRYLNVADVAHSLKKRVSLLRKGETPASLNLGDVPPAMAEQLLIMLYKQWCEDKQSRTHPRRTASGAAEICTGLAAMHFYVSGDRFRQPGGSGELNKMQREEIATFGRVATRHEEDDQAKAQGFSVEAWQLKDDSRLGLRLERPDTAATGRYQLHQLVAVRPADGKSFILGMVRWLSVGPDLILRAGVRTMPGMPKGVAVRGTGLNATTDKYVPALLLPPVPALGSPESLVVPNGWFKPKRVIELIRDGSSNVALGVLLERGTDYERVTFEPA